MSLLSLQHVMKVGFERCCKSVPKGLLIARLATPKRLQIRFQAYEKISPNAPPPRVIHLPTIISMTLQISIVTAFQIGVYFWTIKQEWFCSVSDNFPDCFIRDESGDIIRAKKGFHLTANQMPRKLF